MTNHTHSTPQDAERAEPDGCCNSPDRKTAPLRALSLTTNVLCGSRFRWGGYVSSPPIMGSFNTNRVAGFDWQAIVRQYQQITLPDVDLQGFTRSKSLLHQEPKTHSGSKAHQLPASIIAISKSCLNLGVHIPLSNRRGENIRSRLRGLRRSE
jgi:hypothetical protein